MEFSSSFPGWLIFLALILGLLLRLLAGYLDKQRITSYLQLRGSSVLSIRWTPFGVGWYGEKSDRIYEVVYLDEDRQRHTAACKTSMATGVYFSEDRTSSSSRALRPATSLRVDHQQTKLSELKKENVRLHAELAKLKQP